MRINTETIKEQLATRDTIEKKDFILLAKRQKCDFSENSVYWIINKMLNDKMIRRVGAGKYQVINGKGAIDYSYCPSDKASKIIKKVAKQFPLMDFQIWESIQYNYFANHQIANNTIFFETDKMLLESIFEFLKNNCKENVLLAPDAQEYARYANADTIVVQRQVTEAPTNKMSIHTVPIEKLLVDMLTDKTVAILLSKNERFAIGKDILLRYNINIAKAKRYAKRRNAIEKLESILE